MIPRIAKIPTPHCPPLPAETKKFERSNNQISTNRTDYMCSARNIHQRREQPVSIRLRLDRSSTSCLLQLPASSRTHRGTSSRKWDSIDQAVIGWLDLATRSLKHDLR